MNEFSLPRAPARFGMPDLFSRLLLPERLQANAIKITILLISLWAAFAVPGFTSPANVHAIMYSVAAVGVAAVGMAFITLSGHLFMLSMGATAALCTIVFASTLHLGLPLAMALVLVAGAAVGLVQGVIVAWAGANPIIATIAAASILMGVGSLWSGGLTVIGQGDASWLGVGTLFGLVPNQVMLFVLIALAADQLVERTRIGRELRLIGLNPSAAALAGLRIGPVLVLAFVFAGITAALSGGLIASQATQGNLKLGAGLDFDAIAAVLVGGVAIKGGRGRIMDAAFGAVFLALVSNILLITGLAFETQLVVKGLVVMGSVISGALLTGGYQR